MKIKAEEATHRLVMLGEIQSYHSSKELAIAAAKKLAKENKSYVFVEEWSTVASVRPPVPTDENVRVFTY